MKSAFSYIELCAGIGGFRLGLDPLGGQCLLTSEIDQDAQKTYASNYGDKPEGDLFTLHDIPEHDLLVAGFPCQPFSKAGLGRGFEDERGNVFFGIMRIVRKYKPKAIILENVKNFAGHDNGNTLNTVYDSLISEGYNVSSKVLNATDFGLAQNRERTFIVASRTKLFDFAIIDDSLQNAKKCISDIIVDDVEHQWLEPHEYTLIQKEDGKQTPKSGMIFSGYLNKAPRNMRNEKLDLTLSRCHKQPNRIYASHGTHPTLSAQESSGRYYIEINGRVRKLTNVECLRLQGFPDNFIMPTSLSKFHKQIGNAVPPIMIKHITKSAMQQGCV